MNSQEFSMTCSCGDEMKVDAKSRQEAVLKLQDIMDEESIEAHMAEKHPGEPVPGVAQIHAMIAESLEAVGV